MSTTTPDAIRDAIAQIVHATTPTTATNDPFREHREEVDVRAWAEQNPATCLRRFSVRWLGALTLPTVTNTDVEWVGRSIEVVVCYPKTWRAGGLQLAGLDDAIARDLKLLAHRCGTNGAANLAAILGAATVTVQTVSEEPIMYGPVFLGVLTLTASYYRSNIT